MGRHITQPGDRLIRITLQQLLQFIRKPDGELHSQIQRLRALKALDKDKYRSQKTQLPYFTCGIFHPPVRRTENFARIELFVLDLDHLGGPDRQAEQLRRRLEQDARLIALFSSPGGDGLKLVLRLSEPCTDAALFSAFYKVFVARFGRQYDLQSQIDLRTCDVTRACFLSHDLQAVYRPDGQAVVLSEYVDPENFEQSQATLRKAEEVLKQLEAPTEKKPLDDDVLQRISKLLNPNYRPPVARQVYLPPEIEKVMPLISQRLHSHLIQLVSTRVINYGRQLRVAAGPYWAEINIFYGKNGFRVVKTTKSGSNARLADMAWQVICETLFG